MNPLLGAKHHITDEGVFTQEQLLVGKMINDYNPTLHLAKNPNYRGEVGQMDSAVVCFPAVGEPYPLFYINQRDIDYRVLARIYAADMAKQKRPLEDQLQANEMALKLYEQAKYEDDRAEMADLHRSIIQSKLHTYKHKGKVYR